MRLGACLLAVTLTGCVTRPPQTLAQRFIRHDRSETTTKKAQDGTSAGADALRTTETDEALAKALAVARQLAAAPRPPRSDAPRMLERRDPELAAARKDLAIAPTAENHVRVAEAYTRDHVLDAAFDHFTAALHIAPKDAVAYEGRARIWRDWGFVDMALSDASRAVYYAPHLAGPRNTLGTILLKRGLLVEARAAFERALALDASADYARANICYVSMLQSDILRAMDVCREAGAPSSNDPER